MTQKQLLELLARQVRFRVLRGGSWDNYGNNYRSAYRNSYGPDYRYYHLGFRVVCIRRNHDAKTDS